MTDAPKRLRRIVRVKDAVVDVADLSACTRSGTIVDGKTIVAVCLVIKTGATITVPMDATSPMPDQMREAQLAIRIIEAAWRAVVEGSSK